MQLESLLLQLAIAIDEARHGMRQTIDAELAEAFTRFCLADVEAES